MHKLIANMEMIEDLGWSTVVQSAWNTNAGYPIVETLVGPPERTVAKLTSISVSLLGQGVLGFSDFVIYRLLYLGRCPYSCQFSPLWESFDNSYNSLLYSLRKPIIIFTIFCNL